MINFFDNAYKVAVSEDVCEDCGSHIVDVDFSKVCIFVKIVFLRASGLVENQFLNSQCQKSPFKCGQEVGLDCDILI